MRRDYYVRFENLTIELSNLMRNSKTNYPSRLAEKLDNLVPVPKHTRQF